MYQTEVRSDVPTVHSYVNRDSETMVIGIVFSNYEWNKCIRASFCFGKSTSVVVKHRHSLLDNISYLIRTYDWSSVVVEL